jgi:hypothetical protein
MSNDRQRLWIIALIGALLAVVFAALWIANADAPQSVPDWITAVATLLAVVFAAAAARAANHQLHVLRDEARDRSSDFRMRQARLVYWSEGAGPGASSPGYELRLYNLSQEPIVSHTIYITTPKGRVQWYLGDLMPTPSTGVEVPQLTESINKTKQEWFGKEVEGSKGQGFWGPHAFRVDMVFRDSAGRQWHRRADMSLTQVDSGREPYIPDLDDHQSNF